MRAAFVSAPSTLHARIGKALGDRARHVRNKRRRPGRVREIHARQHVAAVSRIHDGKRTIGGAALDQEAPDPIHPLEGRAVLRVGGGQVGITYGIHIEKETIAALDIGVTGEPVRANEQSVERMSELGRQLGPHAVHRDVHRELTDERRRDLGHDRGRRAERGERALRRVREAAFVQAARNPERRKLRMDSRGNPFQVGEARRARGDHPCLGGDRISGLRPGRAIRASHPSVVR